MLYGFVYIQYIYWEIDNPDLGFPGALNSKEFACNAGDPSSIPGLGRSPEREHGNTLQYSCLENSYRQRSLAGYSPPVYSLHIPNVDFCSENGDR